LKIRPSIHRLTTLASDDGYEDEDEDDYVSEEEGEPEEADVGVVAQVLEGVEVKPLAMNTDGAAEALSLGYSSKLVSNWYQHTCQYNCCQSRWSEFAVVDDDEADL